ncbi:hypothetical protein GX50_07843 [[Emmonsia] crescens]|uniref:C2H2-type domain-containing protein n=1 Tax=[Emmonsia] crescens TaxID=73230 RepID=A0A2B7Z756_9EURO|nr:hypothetical protein GX50_07843 [Emmonsia crescens]
MVNLGKYLTRNDCGQIEYECAHCYKTTTSLTALGQHCRDSPAHAWCWRCERVFPHDAALRNHLIDSSSHNICERDDCDEDFLTYSDWVAHNEELHNWCQPCNWFANSQYELREHDIEDHFMCEDCDLFFHNDNNLRMHMITHQERDKQCYGCDKMFKSFSSMLIHLESGNCCTSRDELNTLAADFSDSDEYFQSFHQYYPFHCPDCGIEFRYLSALYQHVEMRPDCQYLLEHPNCLQSLEYYLEYAL